MADTIDGLGGAGGGTGGGAGGTASNGVGSAGTAGTPGWTSIASTGNANRPRGVRMGALRPPSFTISAKRCMRLLELHS